MGSNQEGLLEGARVRAEQVVPSLRRKQWEYKRCGFRHGEGRCCGKYVSSRLDKYVIPTGKMDRPMTDSEHTYRLSSSLFKKLPWADPLVLAEKNELLEFAVRHPEFEVGPFSDFKKMLCR